MNKTALIFGSTSGFGWEFSKLAYQNGWNISCFGRRYSRLLGFKAAYCVSEPERCHIFKGDITNKNSVEKFIDESINKFKTIDLILVCSGIYSTSNETALETNWRSVFETNFWGTYNVINKAKGKTAGINNNKLVIIVLTSSLARTPTKESGPYSASKQAMEIYIKSVMTEKEKCNDNIIAEAVIVPPFKSEMNNRSRVPASRISKSFYHKFVTKYFNNPEKRSKYGDKRNRAYFPNS